MIKVLSGAQMKSIDRQAIEELKIPGILLMENAGRAVYQKTKEIIKEEEKSVLVVCGKGNNGGDGFVAARHLIENSIQTTVISLFRPENLSGEALVNHNILQNFTEIIYFEDIDLEKLRELISFSDVVIDAIFGTGLISEVKGFLTDIIEAISEYAEGYVVSVDIPSGINADTGEIMNCAVVADFTVTFHAPKAGLLLYPGADYSGEITIASIGIPEMLNQSKEFNIYLITPHYAALSLPLRPDDSHKGTFGKVFNIAGSFAMPGAAYMCAMSSLIVGAGYSILAAPKSVIPSVAAKASEIVYAPLIETPEGTLCEESLSEALDKSYGSNVILIGPGLSADKSTVNFVNSFIREIINRGDKVLLDGDAINALAIQKNIVFPLNSVITPHPKELSRLMGVSVEEILKNKIKFAREAAEKFNAIIVLKGANTIISEPNGNTYINIAGNSGLAKAGSGDVLSGVIAGFIAQGVEPKNAAILGVYLHGLAADIAAEEINEYSLTAETLMQYLPKAINEVLKFT
ncbi:MAG TPA: NAD(P)H-hydrate dehydratase [Candidatus Gastranaerophilales bacterium]|nr:NAD(P)H-hydrate dehydratase [Candidatus Gastranaerophilales bacterium]